MEGLLGFALAGLALAGSPGPATLSLAATGAAFGARRGLGYMAGIIAGMAITATGVTSLLMALPGVAPLVTGLAAAYFIYLAIRIATAPPLTETGHSRHRPSFAAGFFLSLVNPKGYAAMAALFSGFVLTGDNVILEVAAKMLVLLAIITTVLIAWLFSGAALTRLFRAPATNRAINVAFAVLLIVSVAAALLL